MTFQKDDIKEKSYEKSGKTANYKKKTNKIRIFKSNVFPVLLFGCETWCERERDANMNVMRTLVLPSRGNQTKKENEAGHVKRGRQ